MYLYNYISDTLIGLVGYIYILYRYVCPLLYNPAISVSLFYINARKSINNLTCENADFLRYFNVDLEEYFIVDVDRDNNNIELFNAISACTRIIKTNLLR